MKNYIGTKQIKAQPMNRADYNDYRGWELPADEDGTDEGYLVEYVDGGQANHPEHTGYISWSPKAVFEKAYKEIEGMTFGTAIEALRVGLKVARAGWNGKGMFLIHIDPYSTDQYKITEGEALVGTLTEYIAMKTADEKLVPWLASQTDVLAMDWTIVS